MSTQTFLENRDAFVETDPDLKLDVKLMAAVGVNNCAEHDTSARSIMLSSHSSQTLTLNHPEVNIFQSGLEVELGKSVIAKVVEQDSEVLAVVSRYKTTQGNYIVEDVIIYRELETGIVNCIEIPKFNKYHSYFGFEYVVNEDVKSYVRSDIIPKGTILAKPPTLKDDGSYGPGINLNVAQMTLAEVDEDGFVFSKSAVKKFGFKIYETRTIEVGEKEFLLNIYGDEDNYKPYPSIGDKINSTGVVAVSRAYNDLYAPGMYSTKDTMEFNPIFDNAVYVRGEGGTVVDIKVYRNAKKKKMLPTGTDKLCSDYANALISYNKQLIDVYEAINNEYRNTMGKDIATGNELSTLLVEAYGVVESSNPASKIKKMYRKEVLDLYRIEFEIEYDMTDKVTIGYKPTDMHGGK